jgi:hypothetical protein
VVLEMVVYTKCLLSLYHTRGNLTPDVTCKFHFIATMFHIHVKGMVSHIVVLVRLVFQCFIYSTASFLSKLRAKKVEKLRILVIKQLQQMTAYRKFRK